MKWLSLIVVTAVLALSAAKTSRSFDSEQSSCDVRYKFHEDLAFVLTNDTSVQMLYDFKDNLKDICMDPRSHYSITRILDALTYITTNPQVATSAGKLCYFTRKAIKNENFRAIWYEMMKTVDFFFNHAPKTK